MSGARVLEAHVVSSWSEAPGGGPRQHLIDVAFPGAPVAVDYISFRNFYTAAITVSHTGVRAEDDPLQPMHAKGRPPSWQVAVPRVTLMANPHCEDDAQRYHELAHALHFAKDFDHRRVTRLRICCIQPSPSWREYGLKQLRFYSLEPPSVPALQPPPSLTDAQRDLAAAVLDQLISLGQVAGALRRDIATGAGASCSSTERAGPATRGGSCASCGSCGSSGGSGGCSFGTRRVENGAHALAPYLVGEWNDELRLALVDGSALSTTAGAGVVGRRDGALGCSRE
eukprot:jgi/Chrpa1/2382/Chrysochromulina_OHIO_Genome00009350-RA